MQDKAIPEILQGRDAVVTSPTGTGKTLAYLLPVFQKLDARTELIKRVQALILVPTYELAAQIHTEACKLWKNGEFLGREPVLLLGGAGIGRQIEALKEKPRVVVGTPGRVNELIKLKKIGLHFVKFIVLDECDRLFDKNNTGHVADILKTIPRSRQTLLFSATAPNPGLFSQFVREPVFVNIAGKREIPENITHRAIICERRDKFAGLRGFIHNGGVKKALLFVNNGADAERAAERLSYHGIKAAALSAEMSSAHRKAAINKLREGSVTLIAATDAAARGLDIAGLTHVFNMEPTKTPEEYLHRAGRTGRMKERGVTATFVTEGEKARLDAIARALNIKMEYK